MIGIKAWSLVVVLLNMTTMPFIFASRDCQMCRFNGSSRCIGARRICDGNRDCPDGSDERNCENWECYKGLSKCPGNEQCVRTRRICDGTVNCADASDEDPEFCRGFECPVNFRKCRNQVQCVYEKNFCDKRIRGLRQYHCQDLSDESVWGCNEIGVQCNRSNGLWPCAPKSSYSQCISLKKVCDNNKMGLANNECEGNEDEDEEMCQNFRCADNLVKCDDVEDPVCIHVDRICDGNPDCPLDGRDEYRMPILTNNDNKEKKDFDTCSNAGSACLVKAAWHVHQGRRCDSHDQYRCIKASLLCDGQCHCTNSCFDENPNFCRQQWQCFSTHFRCHYSGRCLSKDKICDGVYDCGQDDVSDEADCHCDAFLDVQSAYTRKIVLATIKEFCNLDKSHLKCLDNNRLRLSIDKTEKIVHVLSQCTAEFEDNFECLFNGTGLKRVGDHFAATLLPLVHRNFGYSLRNNRDHLNDLDEKWDQDDLYNNDIAKRLFAAIKIFVDKNKKNMNNNDIKSCKVGRVSYFNAFNYRSLPPVEASGVRNYFYSSLHAHLADFELIYSLGCLDNADNAVDVNKVKLNDVFPTVIYGPGIAGDDKNVDIDVVHVNLDAKRLDKTHEMIESDSSKLTLLALLHFYKYFSNDTVIVDSKNKDMRQVNNLINLLCREEPKVFEYVYSTSNISYLLVLDLNVTVLSNLPLVIRLKLNNVRRNRYEDFRLKDRIFSKHITIVVTTLDYDRVPLDRRLLHELLLRPEVQLQQDFMNVNKKYLAISVPRDRRRYVALNQLGKNVSLGQTMLALDIRPRSLSLSSSMMSFTKVCDTTRERCELEFISDTRRIEKILESRWSQTCLNVRLNGAEYKILRGDSDKYIFKLTQNLFDSESKIKKWPKLTQKTLSLKVLNQKSDDEVVILVDVEGSITNELCPLLTNIVDERAFYEPILLSALLHNNKECLRELCNENDRFYYRSKNDFNFLGPVSALWKSACFSELGMNLVSEILEADTTGLLTINKFWAFDTESFNHLIYKADHNHLLETCYLSNLAFFAELLLTLIMSIIALVTVLGNGFVMVAIMVDGVVQKSVYQYLQMSLCLADVMMGLAGSGGIVATQLQLFAGNINIDEFVENNAFVDAFDNPREALRSGLNHFYFLTKKPARIVVGTLVCLSTTTSLTLLSLMAYTRYHVVRSVHLATPSALFLWLTQHPWASSTLPWLMGSVLAVLNLVDFSNLSLKLQAFFDPVSKVTLLLPASSMPLNFYLQALISAAVSLLTLVYSLMALKVVQQHTKFVRKKHLVQDDTEIRRRLNEEQRWLHLTLAIYIAFILSTCPLAAFYVASAVFDLEMAPLLQLLVWWLLVCGSLFNVAIYTCFNDNMKRTIKRLFNSIFKWQKSTNNQGNSNNNDEFNNEDNNEVTRQRRMRFSRAITNTTSLPAGDDVDKNEMVALNNN